MASVAELIWRILADTAFLTLYVAGLLFLCAVVLHQLDRIISGMLSQTFGWKSVLWTGWLGTPVHELSHAALCPIFFHKIEKLVLYNPDPKTGVLGYVAHSYNPKNPWARIGGAFIGMAPLLGGSLALSLAMYLLVPSSPLQNIAAFNEAAFSSSSGLIDQAAAALRLSTTIVAQTLTVENLTGWQFWLFLYLVLCIGTHMSPSKADFAGSYVGFWVLCGLLLGMNAIAQIWGGMGEEMIQMAARYTMPVVALLMMAVALNLVSLVGVFLLVALYRIVRRDSSRPVSRILSPHVGRLAIVAGISSGIFLLANTAGEVKWKPMSPLPDRASWGKLDSRTQKESSCGALFSCPSNISHLSWLKYTCQTRREAGQKWSHCLRRRSYAENPGQGCPPRKRCCPP